MICSASQGRLSLTILVIVFVEIEESTMKNMALTLVQILHQNLTQSLSLFPQFLALVAVAVLAIVGTVSAHAVTINSAVVCNAADSNDGTQPGGTCETAIALCTHLPTSEELTEPHPLSNARMGTDAHVAGTSRSGAVGTTPHPLPTNAASGNRPSTYAIRLVVSRFANWAANGSPAGSMEAGSCALVGGQMSGDAAAAFARLIFTTSISTEDEWYKTAHYKSGIDGADRTDGTQNGTQNGDQNGDQNRIPSNAMILEQHQQMGATSERL